MYPHERSLVKHLAGKPFALIGVNSDQKNKVARNLAQTGEVTWRSFWNGPRGMRGPISQEWAVNGWPTIYLLDPEGKIRYKGHGEDLNENIAMLMEEIGEEFPLDAIEATTAKERKREFGEAATEKEDSSGEDS